MSRLPRLLPRLSRAQRGGAQRGGAERGGAKRGESNPLEVVREARGFSRMRWKGTNQTLLLN